MSCGVVNAVGSFTCRGRCSVHGDKLTNITLYCLFIDLCWVSTSSRFYGKTPLCLSSVLLVVFSSLYSVEWEDSNVAIYLRLGRVVATPTPNRNYELKKKSHFLNFTSVWLSNIKFVKRRKFTSLKQFILAPILLPLGPRCPGRPHHWPPATFPW